MLLPACDLWCGAVGAVAETNGRSRHNSKRPNDLRPYPGGPWEPPDTALHLHLRAFIPKMQITARLPPRKSVQNVVPVRLTDCESAPSQVLAASAR